MWNRTKTWEFSYFGSRQINNSNELSGCLGLSPYLRWLCKIQGASIERRFYRCKANKIYLPGRIGKKSHVDIRKRIWGIVRDIVSFGSFDYQDCDTKNKKIPSFWTVFLRYRSVARYTDGRPWARSFRVNYFHNKNVMKHFIFSIFDRLQIGSIAKTYALTLKSCSRQEFSRIKLFQWNLARSQFWFEANL